jgi:hypothetical protein
MSLQCVHSCTAVYICWSPFERRGMNDGVESSWPMTSWLEWHMTHESNEHAAVDMMITVVLEYCNIGNEQRTFKQKNAWYVITDPLRTTTSRSVGVNAWNTVPTHTSTYIHITGPGQSMVYTAADWICLFSSWIPLNILFFSFFFFFLIFQQPKGSFPPDRQKVSEFII